MLCYHVPGSCTKLEADREIGNIACIIVFMAAILGSVLLVVVLFA